MRNALPHRRILAATVIFIVFVVGAFAANAAFRGGCSLLPVALPESSAGTNQTITSEQACAALGRPLPHARALPEGVHETWSSISHGGPGNIPRMVTVAYVKDGQGVGQLIVFKGDAIPAGNSSEVNGTVAGEPAVIQQTHIAAFDGDDAHYLWAHDGVLFSLHVHLTLGITREAADAMAASIR